MKKFLFVLLMGLFVLSACSSGGSPGADAGGDTLLVSAGETEQTFSVGDLQALTSTEATFNDVAYLGVTVSDIAAEAGVDPASVKAVKAVAADGYSVNYDPGQIIRDDVIVAYALADGGELSADDGTFRMVLPGEEGKLNLRMMVELQFIQ